MSKRFNGIIIGKRRVGVGVPCFIIAEAGVNHNGNLRRAKKMVDAAKKLGADAVKFQSFKADKLATAGAPKAAYQKRATGARESQLQMLRRFELDPEMHRVLAAYCRKKGILFMSAPFEEESADLLDQLGVPVFKIPSGELTNLPFLDHVARKGKPMLVSTGMATLSEVAAAVKTIRRAGNKNILLLHCVSNYPAKPADVNLRAMDTLASTFGVPVGYSDHTLGVEVALAAAARGACVIEKHFTLDRNLRGPDHAASLTPPELKAMIQGIRRIELALGNGKKVPARNERPIAAVARKSLVAACRIPAGISLTEEMIVVKRPGTGISPGDLPRVMRKSAKQTIAADTLLSWDMLQ